MPLLIPPFCKTFLFPAIGLAYLANGMQLVLLAWLATQVLGMSALGVGALFAVMLLPQIALLPLSGRMADSQSPLTLVKLGCAIKAISHFALLLAFWLGLKNTGILFLYAAMLGVGVAFFLPSKDKIVVQYFPRRLQRSISLGSAFQFAGILVGALLAGLVDTLGVIALLMTQCVCLVLALLCWSRLSMPDSKNVSPVITNQRTQVGRPPALRQLFILCAITGFLHMGFALALFPELGLKHWQLSSFEYGVMQAVFYLGAVVVYIANAYKKPQQYPGQTVLFCLLYTAGIAYSIARGPTFWGGYGLIFLWGAVAGYSASMSRVLLHSIIQDAERGQVSALYQRILLTAAPVGSIVCGVLLQQVGLYSALMLVTALSILTFAGFLLTRTLWGIEQPLS